MVKNVICRQKYLQKMLTLVVIVLVTAVTGCLTRLTDYYEFKDFEILVLGTNISDMIMDPTQPYLYLADYENNALLRIDVSEKMTVDRKLILGSHPIALDITRDQRYLIVAFNGESKLKKINLETFVPLDDTISVSLAGVNDFVCASGNRIFVSGYTETNAVSIDLTTKQERFEIIRSGELLVNNDGSKIFLATNNIVQKYDLSSGYAIQGIRSAPFGFNAAVNHFILGPEGDHIFLCIAEVRDQTSVGDVFEYNTEDLTLKGKYEIKSAGMGVAVSKDGKRVFCAPFKKNEAGVFIVEFDSETKLEQEYYLTAGNIKARGMVIDKNDRYLYVIVNTPLDDDSFEPYNNNSFDLQRIGIN